MIYLILSVVCSMLISVLMRASEKRVKNNVTMLAANYVMCTVLALFFTRGIHLFPMETAGSGLTIGLGVINGMLYLGAFMLLQWNIRVNGVVLPSTFMKLGVLVPIVVSIVVFRDKPEIFQIIGIAISIAAILLIQLEKGGAKAKSSLGLIMVLLCGGCADAMSTVFERLGNADLNSHFLLYTFFCALILCIVLCLVKKQGLKPADAFFGLMIGIPNYLSSRFFLLSISEAGGISPLIAYPFFSVGTIVLVTLAGAVFFKEKLSKKQIIALVLILIALALLNLKI